MSGQAAVEAGTVLDRRFGAVGGVLFDIDDTLVDLGFAMTTALRDVSEHLLPGLDQAGWEKFGRIFTHETTHYYDRYLAGELTFNEQRLLRGRAALGHFGVELGEGEESAAAQLRQGVRRRHAAPGRAGRCRRALRCREQQCA